VYYGGSGSYHGTGPFIPSNPSNNPGSESSYGPGASVVNNVTTSDLILAWFDTYEDYIIAAVVIIIIVILIIIIVARRA
jgi:hypothetical protein